MLKSYSFSEQGRSHKQRDLVCQDSHLLKILDNGWYVAAIADGVGSSKHSEIASRLACETVVSYISEHVDTETDISEASEYIKEAYIAADSAIREYVASVEGNILDYDTTLDVIIYDGKTVAYGHSGDGGIVGLQQDGTYIRITQPQKDDDGVCVIPLRFGISRWEFGTCDKSISSVLMATDGIYDVFFPYLLKNTECEIYIPLIRWFMDSNWLSCKSEDELHDEKLNYLLSDSCKSITDDMTLAVIFNEDNLPEERDASYYAEPDWKNLEIQMRHKLYPHLFKEEEKEQVKEESTNETSDSFGDKNND